jgi:PAS domain S-box-containing protein
MPLIAAFEFPRFAERAHRLRQNPVAAYGITGAAVAAATLLRWAVGGYAMEGTPFITYYPAILIAALFGGFWPGVLATIASAILAWFAFIPPEFTFTLSAPEAVSLLLFMFISSINVILVAMLNVAVERVMAQEQNVRILIESAPNGIVVVDKQGIIRRVNSSTEKIFGYDRLELLGQAVEVLVPEPKLATHRVERQSYQHQPKPRSMGIGRDLSGRRKDGSEFPIEIGLNPITQNGNSRVLATVIDISERKQAQDRQQFLLRELQHRSQNLIAVIQAIAGRSFGEGRTFAEAKLVFEGRLQALARAHGVMAEAAMEGASLVDILNRELAAFSANISVNGCHLIVNTVTAQHFALIVHELATNAVKYGALSLAEGRVLVEGKLERVNGESLFSWSWNESGGPPVSKPRRTGFGSLILLDGAKRFGRRVALNYEWEGLRYELQFPVLAIAGRKEQDAAAQTAIRAG